MTMIGYARCSTLQQDLAAQRSQLSSLGVPDDRMYTDEGYTGTKRSRPGLDQALAAVREGDTFVVTKLDRLARSVPDALDLLNQLSNRGVKFAMGGSVYDWADPFGRMFLTILATIAEFEGALIRQRTREGMAIARSKGKLRGRQPKLSAARHKALIKMYNDGEHSISDLSAIFEISRPTVYREILRHRASTVDKEQAIIIDVHMSYQEQREDRGTVAPSRPPEGQDEDFSAQQDPANPPQVGPAGTRDAPEGWLDDLADSLEEQDRAAAYVEELAKTKPS